MRTPPGTYSGFGPDTSGKTFRRGIQKAAAYASRGNPSTTDAQDSIYVNGGKRGLLALKKVSAGYVGTIAMGVHK